MTALIEWSTVGEIFAESVVAGVVVVGAFALGARLVAANANSKPVADGAPSGSGRRITGYALAVFCFLVAALAVAYGVYFTIDK